MVLEGFSAATRGLSVVSTCTDAMARQRTPAAGAAAAAAAAEQAAVTAAAVPAAASLSSSRGARHPDSPANASCGRRVSGLLAADGWAQAAGIIALQCLGRVCNRERKAEGAAAVRQGHIQMGGARLAAARAPRLEGKAYSIQCTAAPRLFFARP